MIVVFLLMSVILMMSIQTSMATEKDIMSNDVIKQAFDNNVNKISCIPETIETIEVYDSRLDEKEIISSITYRTIVYMHCMRKSGISGDPGGDRHPN